MSLITTVAASAALVPVPDRRVFLTVVAVFSAVLGSVSALLGRAA